MDPKTINYIKSYPNEAGALALKWQDFLNIHARENPEILSIKSREAFNAWAAQHPEKNFDTNIWLGKEIQDVLSQKSQQQGEENKPTENEKQSQEERGREQGPSISARDINRIIKSAEQPQATIPQPTYQPKPPTPTRGFFNRGIGRGPARLGGRFAARSGSMAGRLASRLAVQAGMAVGRAAVSGVVALAGTPPGWIVIGVIILIIIIVFLIIMFAGGGGGKPIATIDCGLDPDGNIFVAADGNTCAQNLAAYYSKQESATITAKCLDKCVDPFRTLSCDRDPATNECDIILYNSCGGDKAFCIEYTPANAALDRLFDCVTGGLGYEGSPGGVNSCGGTSAPAETPTPTPAPTTAPTPTPIPPPPTPTPACDYFATPDRCNNAGIFCSLVSGTCISCPAGYLNCDHTQSCEVAGNSCAASKLATPALSFPTNGATGVSTTTTFTWSDVGAAGYQIFVNDTTTGTAPVNLRVNTNSATPSITAPFFTILAAGDDFSWSVQACVNAGCAPNDPNDSNWSAERAFTTVAAPTPTP